MSYKFQKQFISLNDKSPLGDISIVIETPNLVNGPRDVYGDWGPNCLFDIDAKDPLKVHYKTKDHKEESIIEANTLEFKSPMLYETREQFPFFLEFEDKSNHYVFNIYFDNDGNARKVDFRKETHKTVEVSA